MPPGEAAHLLIQATLAMHRSGTPLMRRLLPAETEMRLWDHYPPGDVCCPVSGARYFYHAHPPEERGTGEHGHFHLFLPVRAMAAQARPLVAPDREAQGDDWVHLVALAISAEGLPTSLFTVNRWVTDECLYPAQSVMQAIGQFDLRGAAGDPLVNQWLTAAVALCAPLIGALLVERDSQLLAHDPGGENRAFEVLSRAPIDLQRLLDTALEQAPVPSGTIGDD